jgi:hypothetical protein
MSVKEKIFDEVENMGQRELSLIYDQIQLLKKRQAKKKRLKRVVSIEELHRHTASSKSSWSEAIIQDREDRV